MVLFAFPHHLKSLAYTKHHLFFLSLKDLKGKGEMEAKTQTSKCNELFDKNGVLRAGGRVSKAHRNSLERDRISPATRTLGQLTQARCLDLTHRRPGLYSSPLYLASCAGVLSLSRLHTPPPSLLPCQAARSGISTSHMVHPLLDRSGQSCGIKTRSLPGPSHHCP